MDRNAAQSIIDSFADKLNTFDSHDFIKEYIKSFTRSYAELLIKHNDVTKAHAEIGNFLRNNADSLGIIQIEESLSLDIFNNETSCANWKIKS